MRPAAVIAAVAALLTPVALAGVAAGMALGDGAGGRFDRPQQGFAPPGTVLADATPEQAGLDPAPIRQAEQRIAQWTRPDPATGHPLLSGAVAMHAHDGKVVDAFAAGGALRFADRAGHELPAAQQVPMRPDTIVDMASVSKLFTAIAVTQLVERGQLELDAPAARYLPEFASHGKDRITVRQLLTHTSGLRPDPEPPLWQAYPDIAARRRAILDTVPQGPPGAGYEYSDLNFMTAGLLVERVTGQPLDAVVRQRITEPLGMADTGYNPPADRLGRIAATEYTENPPRGLIRGQVHDDNAWSLGGVAGHAGVFSTARDITVLGQAMLNGGSYAGRAVLRPESAAAMLANYNQRFPDDSHGLGFELDQRWYMGGLSSPRTAGHTGFTGTSLVIDPLSRSVSVLLTNRVHPSREWGSINPAREAWATGLARAEAVRPAHGHDSWFAGPPSAAAATLTAPPQTSRRGPLRVSFDAFVDAEPSDPLTLEASVAGGPFEPVPVTAAGPGAPAGPVPALTGSGHRSWWRVRAELPPERAGNVTLRWRLATDARYTGRGDNVDRIRVSDDAGGLFDGERSAAQLSADGWSLRTR